MGEIIRVCDYVKIIKPEMVLRVGYEYSHEDACKDAKAAYKESVWELMRVAGVVSNKIVEKKIISALAFGLVRKRIQNGNERKIYTELKEEYKDRIVKVSGKRMVQTGTYYPGSSGTAPYYDDAEPGGLKNSKTHIILELDMVNVLTFKPVEIEAINVERQRR